MADLSFRPAAEAALENLVDATADVLAENGPMTVAELESALVGRGLSPGDAGVSLDDVLGASDDVLVVLADDRWASLPALLAGRVFTHRVTGPELEHDILAVNPDLEPVATFAESEAYGQLTDGARMSRVLAAFDADTLTERGIPLDTVDEHGAMLLPPGYLQELGCREGDVVAFRFGQDGPRLEILGPATAEPSTVLGRRLDAVLSLWSGPMLLNEAVWTACANDPVLFTEPLPPLGEALDSCGLVRDGEWIATPGFDFDQWRTDQRRATIARVHRLDDDQSLVVLALATLFERAAGEADSDNAALRIVMPFLADPAVAKAVLVETIGFGQDGAAEFVRFVESLQPMAPRSARPALHWLCGKACERLGDIAKAETDYQTAQAIDPQWAPALVELARYASDRGNAELGLSLLRRAEVPPDDELVELLSRFQTAPRPGLGRNEPCWCGSGRKYKKCHLHNERLPLEERAAWLYQKAGMFLSEGPWRGAVMDLAQLRAQHSDEPHALLDALDDPLVADALLFEGGAFADFVATRGALLPDDERLLAEQWLLADRSVYDIEHVQRGAGLTVRDVRTGDRHQVRERRASRALRAGQLVCVRIVAAADTMQIFGGVEPVALHERDELIALLDAKPGPGDIVSFLTRHLAPAEIRNTEGDPIVLCEVTLRTADPVALTTALDGAYERDGTGAPQWFEHVITDGLLRIRATLRLDENELTAETNSEPRVDRVLDTLHALDPTLAIVRQSRRPARDLREAGTLGAQAPLAASDAEPEPAADDPDMMAALDQFIRHYEQRWLDDRIPALAGYTPREAAADPTRRGDLIRLLSSLPAAHNPGTMNPDRLRAALGLP